MNDEKPLFLKSFGNILSLNRTHKASLNLVTLSACQTALGDDRIVLLWVWVDLPFGLAHTVLLLRFGKFVPTSPRNSCHFSTKKSIRAKSKKHKHYGKLN